MHARLLQLVDARQNSTLNSEHRLRRVRHVYVALLIAISCALLGARAHAAAPNDPMLLLRLDAELRAIMATGQTPGLALGVVYQGQPIYTRALGVTSTELNTPLTADTRFRLASVSKTLSAALIAKLVAQGFLQWETPVTLLVPSFKLRDPNSNFLTVAQLLSHRTGLPHHALDRELEGSVEFWKIRDRLPKVASACAIGACYAYQNLTYSYAADLSYAASGNFFDIELKRQLFEPLSMTRANVGLAALQEDDDWARPHTWRAGKNVAVPVKPNYYWMPAAAGINASLTDMLQWLAALQGARAQVLDPQVLDSLTTPQIATPGERFGPRWRRTRVVAASYGLGMRIFDYAGHRIEFHAGAVQGYRAIVVTLPEKKAGMVLMWNSETNLPAGLLPSVLDRWLDLPEEDWLQLASFVPRTPTLARPSGPAAKRNANSSRH